MYAPGSFYGKVLMTIYKYVPLQCCLISYWEEKISGNCGWLGERIEQKTTEDDSCLLLGICNYSCTELYMLANWTPILIDFVSVCVRMEGYKVAYPSRYAYLMPMTPELLSCIKLDESVPGKADYRKGDASYTGLLINKNVVPFF